MFLQKEVPNWILPSPTLHPPLFSNVLVLLPSFIKECQTEHVNFHTPCPPLLSEDFSPLPPTEPSINNHVQPLYKKIKSRHRSHTPASRSWRGHGTWILTGTRNWVQELKAVVTFDPSWADYCDWPEQPWEAEDLACCWSVFYTLFNCTFVFCLLSFAPLSHQISSDVFLKHIFTSEELKVFAMFVFHSDSSFLDSWNISYLSPNAAHHFWWLKERSTSKL